MSKALAMGVFLVTGIVALGLATQLSALFFTFLSALWAMLWSVGAGMMFWYLQVRDEE